MRALEQFEKQFSKKKLPDFEPGDTVDVHVRIVEGEKERVQIFTGTVIAKRHQGLSETFTVRRLVQGEGVERIFPINSPNVVKVVVKKRGRVRRAKLNYLRDRVGRATKIQEKIGGPKSAPSRKKAEKKAEEKAPEPETEAVAEKES